MSWFFRLLIDFFIIAIIYFVWIQLNQRVDELHNIVYKNADMTKNILDMSLKQQRQVPVTKGNDEPISSHMNATFYPGHGQDISSVLFRNIFTLQEEDDTVNDNESNTSVESVTRSESVATVVTLDDNDDNDIDDDIDNGNNKDEEGENEDIDIENENENTQCNIIDYDTIKVIDLKKMAVERKLIQSMSAAQHLKKKELIDLLKSNE